MSRWPDVVLLLATRCLYLGVWVGGGVHLTKHQPDPQADDVSCWPAVVHHVTTRCLHWGCRWGHQGTKRGVGVLGAMGSYIWKMKTIYCKVLLKTQDSLLQTIEHEFRSTKPKLVPLLAMRSLYQGGTSD